MQKIFCFSLLIFICMTAFTASAEYNTAFWQKRTPLADYADTTGLIALWRMDESPMNTGKILYDYFGNHNGVMTAGGSGNMSMTGKKFRGLNFNTNDYYATIPGSADFNRNSTSTITIMFWFNRQYNNGNACLIAFVYNGSGDPWCPATGDTNSKMSYWDSTANIFASVGTITANTWYHYALVINGSSVKIYWNGALVKTGTGNTSTRTNQAVYISKDTQDNIFLYDDLDEVSYWTRALSDAEILAIYNNQK